MAPYAFFCGSFGLLFGLVSSFRREELAPLRPGDTVECEGTWEIEKVLGSGGQGKVFAVRQGTGPLRAMKIDVKPDGAYHKRQRKPLFIGMPHESVPECGILEALDTLNISAAPRCYAACQLDGYNTFVMTAVDRWQAAYLSGWEAMAVEDRRNVLNDNVQNLFEIIRANVLPVDVEAFIGKDMRLHMLDYGGAFGTDYKSKLRYADATGQFGDIQRSLFEASLPDFQGIGTISNQLCKLDTFDYRQKVKYNDLLPELVDFLNQAFCRLKSDFEDWIAVVAKATIKRDLNKCKNDLPHDFLLCS